MINLWIFQWVMIKKGFAYWICLSHFGKVSVNIVERRVFNGLFIKNSQQCKEKENKSENERERKNYWKINLRPPKTQRCLLKILAVKIYIIRWLHKHDILTNLYYTAEWMSLGCICVKIEIYLWLWRIWFFGFCTWVFRHVCWREIFKKNKKLWTLIHIGSWQMLQNFFKRILVSNLCPSFELSCKKFNLLILWYFAILSLFFATILWDFWSFFCETWIKWSNCR